MLNFFIRLDQGCPTSSQRTTCTLQAVKLLSWALTLPPLPPALQLLYQLQLESADSSSLPWLLLPALPQGVGQCMTAWGAKGESGPHAKGRRGDQASEGQ